MATILQFLKFQFLRLGITFFVYLAPIIVMVPGDCCFYAYYVKFISIEEKKENLLLIHSSNNFSQLQLSLMEPLAFAETI